MGVMNWELTLSILVNVAAIAFFAGNLSANQKLLKESIADIKASFDEKAKELKTGFDEKVKEIKEEFNEKVRDIKESLNIKIEENQQHTTESIKRLEAKQDKHNNIIERTYKIEGSLDKMTEQIKVANHRIEDLEEKVG